jgi:hypothetical protein
MNKQGFRVWLQGLRVPEKQIEDTVNISERFDNFLGEPGNTPSAANAWAFSRVLIKEKKNTFKNYLALFRYCNFIKNNEMLVAFLELIDGGEVNARLYRKVAKTFGDEIRDSIFKGIGVAPYGTPSPDKPAYLNPVIDRLEKAVGTDACKEFLSAGLRDLPKKLFLGDRKQFRDAGDIDVYLMNQKTAFINRLENCRREGRLFFAQEITSEVLDFVKKNPEMGGGKRRGNIVYETKIPYMAKQYLSESDPTLKHYYACHCPWAREAIKNGDVKPARTLCYCSGGFHKKKWEVIFKQPLKVEVLESIINGGELCRFAIHLPE